ncbi:hypothetical protein NPIL_202131 [Nephila pilipes]|uniref:Uncharacterized protein n=1 Tax=Nephila pilipes TaxID=299642 RepID=A0A8X6UH39_NEPPI|nr:hypothetical protein NPIL_321531 [Nephila pilipes]GFT67657.1 hypothetical protein NPIL_578521 [Nephila pilipes]GFT99232.1 hypothetical protein NPIL_298271 [Nephila pilipes]GFU32420.1 hypothetical protein NPIL_202131 [Nephila pilipes]
MNLKEKQVQMMPDIEKDVIIQEKNQESIEIPKLDIVSLSVVISLSVLGMPHVFKLSQYASKYSQWLGSGDG